MSVDVSGQPTPEIKWYRNGREIYDGKRQWIETTAIGSVLTIAEMREDDEGEITVCKTSYFLYFIAGYY